MAWVRIQLDIIVNKSVLALGSFFSVMGSISDTANVIFHPSIPFIGLSSMYSCRSPLFSQARGIYVSDIKACLVIPSVGFPC